jgi:hypothetical protein
MRAGSWVYCMRGVVGVEFTRMTGLRAYGIMMMGELLSGIRERNRNKGGYTLPVRERWPLL